MSVGLGFNSGGQVEGGNLFIFSFDDLVHGSLNIFGRLNALQFDLADRALLMDLLQEVRSLSELVHTIAESGGTDPSRVPVEGEVPARGDAAKKDAELRAWMTRIESGLGNLAKSPGTFPLIDLPPEGLRPTPLPVPAPEDEDPAVARARAIAERTVEIRRSLEALILLEDVQGIDVLEVGVLGRGALGPVVFRILDDHVLLHF